MAYDFAWCEDTYNYWPDKQHMRGTSLILLVLGVLSFLTFVAILLYLRRQSRRAKSDGFSDHQTETLIFPLYIYILMFCAFAALLDAVSNLFEPTRLDNSNTALASFLFGGVWAVYHFAFEGVALLMLNDGVGAVAARRSATMAGIWALFTWFVQGLITYKDGSFLSTAFAVAWDALLIIFYGLLWLLPLSKLFRRPCVMPYARFWCLMRLYIALSNVLRYYGVKFGFCMYLLGSAGFQSPVVAFVVYTCLLRDCKYWLGILTWEASVWDGTSSARAPSTSGGGGKDGPGGLETLRRPLLGTSLAPHSARILAAKMDHQGGLGPASSSSSSSTGPFHPSDGVPSGPDASSPTASSTRRKGVKILNFAFLRIDQPVSGSGSGAKPSGLQQVVLGSGSTSRVFQGTFKGRPVAIKMIFCPDLTPETVTSFYHEATLLAQLQHVNVVEVLGVCVLPPAICLVMELCEAGNLFDFLRAPAQQRQPLTLWRQLSLAWDCCAAVHFLHTHQPAVLHLDLKSLNFLLTREGRVKVADLELSREIVLSSSSESLGRGDDSIVTSGSSLTGFKVPETLYWLAPEIIRGQPYNEKADIYALALVVWEIFTSSVPYRSLEDSLVLAARNARYLQAIGMAPGEYPVPIAEVPYSLAQGLGGHHAFAAGGGGGGVHSTPVYRSGGGGVVGADGFIRHHAQSMDGTASIFSDGGTPSMYSGAASQPGSRKDSAAVPASPYLTGVAAASAATGNAARTRADSAGSTSALGGGGGGGHGHRSLSNSSRGRGHHHAHGEGADEEAEMASTPSSASSSKSHSAAQSPSILTAATATTTTATAGGKNGGYFLGGPKDRSADSTMAPVPVSTSPPPLTALPATAHTQQQQLAMPRATSILAPQVSPSGQPQTSGGGGGDAGVSLLTHENLTHLAGLGASGPSFRGGVLSSGESALPLLHPSQYHHPPRRPPPPRETDPILIEWKRMHRSVDEDPIDVAAAQEEAAARQTSRLLLPQFGSGAMYVTGSGNTNTSNRRFPQQPSTLLRSTLPPIPASVGPASFLIEPSDQLALLAAPGTLPTTTSNQLPVGTPPMGSAAGQLAEQQEGVGGADSNVDSASCSRAESGTVSPAFDSAASAYDPPGLDEPSVSHSRQSSATPAASRVNVHVDHIAGVRSAPFHSDLSPILGSIRGGTAAAAAGSAGSAGLQRDRGRGATDGVVLLPSHVHSGTAGGSGRSSPVSTARSVASSSSSASRILPARLFSLPSPAAASALAAIGGGDPFAVGSASAVSAPHTESYVQYDAHAFALEPSPISSNIGGDAAGGGGEEDPLWPSGGGAASASAAGEGGASDDPEASFEPASFYPATAPPSRHLAGATPASHHGPASGSLLLGGRTLLAGGRPLSPSSRGSHGSLGGGGGGGGHGLLVGPSSSMTSPTLSATGSEARVPRVTRLDLRDLSGGNSGGGGGGGATGSSSGSARKAASSSKKKRDTATASASAADGPSSVRRSRSKGKSVVPKASVDFSSIYVSRHDVRAQLQHLICFEHYRPTLPPDMPDALALLLTRAWHPMPAMRPSATEFVACVANLLDQLKQQTDRATHPNPFQGERPPENSQSSRRA